ncbi:MAG: LLM class flavin-dependent oxidoreductase [Kiritimatiellia bacterium]|jgi:probable F420-dependent oxidoreductase|nr:LLM class flavin-dependent oxidoreductase [Pseudomonadales bacterium]MDP6469388.1 LLM class flavin-dependent oxidoreductase [Pseudomonadales bacterium]MDP6828994.1 LLM class flavin-dependent oxidoreductase [Pseudomonadales bacterium]MDP7024701.1 LLM class flavin-dependent oxidoreductase [Kiritimatiellia bacterium]|tara:strand:+ start:198 stop:1232 length:1035 start_codon:yes stop_codon:yes gene_type:complete
MISRSGQDRRYWGLVAPLPAPLIAMFARQAEEQGLEGLFAPQVLGPPWSTLAVAAANTERLKVSSGIAIAAARSPFETAMAAIDMDRISDGRFILGLGASVQAWTCGLFGAPPHKPLAHLRETVVAVRHIISGAHKEQGLEPFDGQYYKGDFSTLQPLEPPVREEIPIWLAALRGPAVRLAAEIGDGIMGHPIWSVDWAIEKIQPELARGLARGGRKREDVEVNLWFWCAPNTDEAEAIDDARTTVGFYASFEQYESFFAAHGFRDEARQAQEVGREREIFTRPDLVPDEMVRTFVLCGHPDSIRERIERAWTVADSLTVIPPAYSVAPEKIMQYQAAIADLLY